MRIRCVELLTGFDAADSPPPNSVRTFSSHPFSAKKKSIPFGGAIVVHVTVPANVFMFYSHFEFWCLRVLGCSICTTQD
jgi:hypothetical protein